MTTVYKHLSEKLRKLLLSYVDHSRENVILNLENRPIFLMAPNSYLGKLYAPQIACITGGLIASVDDFSTDNRIYGAPRWTSAEFLAKSSQYANAVAIDFSASPTARASIRELCKLASVNRVDCVVAQAQLGMVSVYETAKTYREKTLACIDDFLKLEHRFSDDLSRATLYGNLLFRLTYDRSYMLGTWTNPNDEYFTNFTSDTTFQLGTREHYCDCGAYRGPIVSKFLDATGYQYASIAAFEPDRANFLALEQFSLFELRNFRAINKALSNKHESLAFMETGTMGSHIGRHGSTIIQTTKLDDELDKLTFLKMDVEGFEVKTLEGASSLIAAQRPRIAACVYHYANDLLDVFAQIDKTADNYHFRLRQHNASYYYDLVLYASPVEGSQPPEWVV